MPCLFFKNTHELICSWAFLEALLSWLSVFPIHGYFLHVGEEWEGAETVGSLGPWVDPLEQILRDQLL